MERGMLAEAQERYSLGSLVAFTDQIEAAVSDVYEAWDQMVHGPRNETKGPAASAPSVSDRFQQTGQSLGYNVNRLQELARTIRERC